MNSITPVKVYDYNAMCNCVSRQLTFLSRFYHAPLPHGTKAGETFPCNFALLVWPLKG